MNNIAIFASGSGTNAENIITYFNNNDSIRIKLLAANRNDAFALQRAENSGISTFIFNKKEFYSENSILDTLKKFNIDFIVLAGFLWLVPECLISAYPQRIINIHPALLPKHGGKGMYGMNVHKAVVDNKETKTGITIHIVNNNYDEGDIIFQATCTVTPNDTPETVAEKVHQLEYKHFPQVIHNYIKNLKR